MAKGGALTVTIGAAIQDFQDKMKEAQKEVNQFAKDAKKAGVDLGAGSSVGVDTAKKKYLELSSTLRGVAENVQSVSMVIGRTVSLPLAGIATAALASSKDAKAAFDRFGSDMKFTFGRLGDQLARDLNLDATLASISNFCAKAVTAFSSLPKPIRTVIEDFGLMAIAIPVVGTAISQLTRGLAGVIGLFGRLGPAAAMAAAQTQGAMAVASTGWGAWGTRAAGAGVAGAGAAEVAAGGAGVAGGLKMVGTGVGGFMLGKLVADIFETEKGNTALGLNPETSEQQRQINQLSAALARKEFGGGVSVPTYPPGINLEPNILPAPGMIGLEGIRTQVDSARLAVDQIQKAAPMKEIFSGATPWSQGKKETIQILSDSDKANIERQATEIADLVNTALEGTGTRIERWTSESAGQFLERVSNSINGVQTELKALEDSASQKNIWGPIASKMEKGISSIGYSLNLVGLEFGKTGKLSSDAFLEMSNSSNLTKEQLDAMGKTGEDMLKLMTAAWIKMREDGIEPGNKKLDELTEKISNVRGATEKIKIKVELEVAGQKFSQDMAAIQRAYQTEGGFDPNAAMRQRLIQEREGLIGMKSKRESTGLPVGDLGNQIDALGPKIENLSTVWSRFHGLMASTPKIAQQLASGLQDMVMGFSQGIGNAVAQVLIYGQSMGQMMIALFKQVAATAIATLISIGVQQVLMAVMGAASFAAMTAAALTNYAAQTYAAAFAATCAIPVVGPILAAGVAAGAVTAMLLGAGAAGTAGLAVGGVIGGMGMLGMAAFDVGGISTTPQLASVSEHGQPEIHLTRANIDRYFPELKFGGRGGESVLHNHIHIGDREVAIQVLKMSPKILRERGTGW